MDDTREEMRRLIDVIEKGAKSTSVEQAVDDIKLFANTASFLVNALGTRLKSKDAKPKSKSKSAKTDGLIVSKVIYSEGASTYPHSRQNTTHAKYFFVLCPWYS